MGILVCKDNENLLLTKSNAFQYKELDFTGVTSGQSFEIEDRVDKLVAVPSEGIDEDPIYTVVTDEFGLYAMSDKVSAKVKISFCDNGMMVVSIIEGAILVKPAGDVLLASRGVSNLPKVELDGIFWVNADKLLSYKKYWGTVKENYTQDFEFVFILKGDRKGSLHNFSITLIKDETIDISGGNVAVIEAQLKAKEEAKQVKKSFSSMVNQSKKPLYEFDDDDNDSEDEFNYYDDDVDDGSAY